MFAGGDYDEVARWLRNFATAHAKRENARVEVAVDVAEPRIGTSYGLRLRLGERLLPPADAAPVELAYADVAAGRGSLAWCESLAQRLRALAAAFTTSADESRRLA